VDEELADIEEAGEEAEADGDEAAVGAEDTGPDPALLALAEEPGLWFPQEPKLTVVRWDGFSLVFYGRDVWVQHVRLKGEDWEGDKVPAAVERVAAMAAVREAKSITWWLGELTTPRGLSKRLLKLGLERDKPYRMTSLTIAEPPAGEPTVEVRRVETFDDLLVACEIDWSVFGVPEDERVIRRAEVKEAWPVLEAGGDVRCYLAYVDGEPVGMGRIVFTPRGGMLVGGATLPEARGRGVYTSLVHARWQAAVERGTPRLVVSAGPKSAPILEKLGFEMIGKVRLLKQQPQ
jgi:GNAT superfamily N-acetyltransferase